MAAHSLKDQASNARDWLVDHALPFWGSTGVDPATGAFHERCSLAAAPIAAVPRRLMVQARQIYVFSHAHALGWHPRAGEIAARGLEHLLARYRHAGGRPGFAFSLSPAGEIADPRRNAYGHAFVLLALAWYARATGDSQALAAARETVDFIEAAFADGHGAYFDDAPRGEPGKRQNPQMHMLEAFLALHEATGDVAFLARATRIVELFQARLFDSRTGVLHEHFGDNWRAAPGEAGAVWEPGHQFEWAWLLRLYARLCGTPPLPQARVLFDRARAQGFAGDGRIHDALRDDGSIAGSSTRAWPLTEAAKAGAAFAEQGLAGAEELASRALATLMDRFVGRPWRAGWTDHLDAGGRPLVDYVPASTLYHVFLAVAEAQRVTAA
jgi:mannose/cellobiose epimerase-like protein (N-acyl-D-glucosamine 2-epimerase family)